MLLTLSSSLCKEVSRACSVSYFDSPFRCGGASVCFEDFWFGLDTREGEANRSSLSEESDRFIFPISGVATICKFDENVQSIKV